MSLADLEQWERKVIGECLRAAVEGPFFPEWEFQTLFGLERTEVKKFLDSWPQLDDSNEDIRLAISNAIGNLLGYPHGCDKVWPQFVSVSRAEVKRIFNKWKHGI